LIPNKKESSRLAPAGGKISPRHAPNETWPKKAHGVRLKIKHISQVGGLIRDYEPEKEIMGQTPKSVSRGSTLKDLFVGKKSSKEGANCHRPKLRRAKGTRRGLIRKQ